MCKFGRFSRHTTQYTQSITKYNILSKFFQLDSWYKTVLRISHTAFRTYLSNLTQLSRVMSFMFVVYALDLIVKVWFFFLSVGLG
jgi:hypothetical protein